MFDLVLLVFATFFLWETLRLPLERYAEWIFDLSRPVHPLVVAVLPLVVLWPEWITALAVGGVVGLLVAAVDRFLGTPPQPVALTRRRGLPPFP